MESPLLLRTFSRFLLSALTLLLVTLTATTNSLTGQTLIGPSELLANTEVSYYISDPSVTGDWEVNGSATVSSNLVGQNAIKVKANNYCYGRFTVIVKIGDKYLFRQVNIIKNLPPIFTSGATTATLSCNSTLEDFNKYKPTAKDIDGNAVDVVMKDMMSMQMGRCQSVVTWEATDRCGNKATFTQTIEVVGNTVDTEAPIFDQTTLVKTFYDCDKLPKTFIVPKATDNCVNPVMVKLVRREVSERIRSSIACMSYFEILTWEATDVCGNKRQADQTICVVDNVPPVFVSSTLEPITVFQCGFDYDKYQPKATDNCSNPVMIMAVDIQTTIVDVGRRTVIITWEATDMCGNATRAKQTFNVIDQTPPRINRGLPLPAVAVECNNLINNIQIPLGFDDCGDPVEVILASRRIIVAGNCNGIIELTWKATDASGNMSFAKQIVNINDKTSPIVVCPAPINVSCASQVPAPNTAAVNATDNCDLNVSVAFVNDVISNRTCANRYTITRTYRATDVCGNTATCTQTITVNDQTPPMITCPGIITVSCANLVPAPNTTLPTASDNCGGNVVISHVGDAAVGGECANRFRITRTYMATDLCGNTATCTQTIIVDDQTDPVFTFCPPGANLGCNPRLIPAPGNATATDVCGDVTITSALGNITNNGCNRSQTRTYTATDVCGNTATCTQVFTWTVDAPPPVFTFCPSGSNLGCNPNGVPAPGAATATDDCGAPGITSALGTITTDGCLRSQTRTYTATDACGNTATCTQVFTWTVDAPPPVFTFCPPGSNLGCNPNGVPAPGAATATDACGAVTITSALGTIATNGCQRTQTRTYTATDACGITATCAQVFTWTVDGTPPSFTFCPPDANLGCNPIGVPAPGTATATDACGAVTITSALGTIISNGCNRTQVRTYTATDGCGITSTCAQVFTWTEDITPPVITCPEPITVPIAPLPNPASAMASDNCGGDVAVVHVGDATVEGLFTRTYKATDACGNTATCTQIITVIPNGDLKSKNISEVIKARNFKVSAFPNPTTGDINFSVTAPTKGNLRLKLFDASGKQIGLIQRDDLEGGFENQINYNIPATVSSGLIFYTVTVGEEVKSGKLMYMKN